MKNVFQLLAVVITVFFSTIFSTEALAGPKVLVYNGAGACHEDCAKASYDSAAAAGFDPVYVGDNDTDPAIFNGAVAWMQPGGYASTAMQNMAVALKNNIRNFVKNGGGYVGFCAGAFVATSYVGTTSNRGLGIIPGNTKLYGTGVKILKTKWQGSDRYLYWEGGPYFRNMPSTVESTATYPTGAVGAVRTTYGKGKVWVTGLHPESPQWWKDDSGYSDVDGDDRDIVAKMLHWVTGL